MLPTPSRPFDGLWAVVRSESRIRGAWRCDYNYSPDDWTIGFLPGGLYLEIFRPTGEKTSGWLHCDESVGVISVVDRDVCDGECFECRWDCDSDYPPPSLRLYAFEDRAATGTGAAFLYIFDNDSRISLLFEDITGHHAHTRLTVVRDGAR